MDDPELTAASVVPRSTHGHSIYDVDSVTSENFADFRPDPHRHAEACRHFRRLGFSIHHYDGPAIVIRGAQELFDRVFDPPSEKSHRVHHESHGELADVVDRVNLRRSIDHHGAVSAAPPDVGYPHIVLPTGLVDELVDDADALHGASGSGVRVAVCDSGWFDHPWFEGVGGSVTSMALPGAGSEHTDEIGHGTAVTATLLSLAPACDVVSIKMPFGSSSTASVDSILALQAALQAGADIINCSWGRNVPTPADMTHGVRDLEYVVTAVAAEGPIIVTSSGNYPREDPSEHGDFGYPGQHPDVIAVGGCHPVDDGVLSAADYASGFVSLVYPGRQVPDVCGLCGALPSGILIMAPVPPGSMIDEMAAGGTYPQRDETDGDDGWACFSGTSLAAPQVSATLALLIEQRPDRRDVGVLRDLLMSTARDVTVGSSNPRAVHEGQSNRARRGPDTATGAGLVAPGAALARG